MSAICANCGASNRDGAAFCGACGQPLAPATATGSLAAFTLLNGRYEIVETVGGGGMGAVYKAFDFQQDRLVAVKEMSDQALGAGHREQAAEQFRREALLLQALSHPNLVKVTDTFSEGRRHYLVMDFVDGQALPALIAPQQEGWQEQVRAWALQLCDVLAYLHGRQPPVIFRDLKPDNILLPNGEERLKLIDFGIARFFDPAKERDTVAIGTPGYMAPEAFYGQTDARSDLYSLGVTLHTLLTGFDPAQAPWQLPSVAELAPHVAEDLAQIVAHAIELDPEQRFQTAQEFKRALGGELAAPAEAVEATAQAAPVAARVSTARPVRFNGREQVTSLPQLVALCDSHWDAAVNHLRVGELEVWLDHLGETELARYARELRQEGGADMGVQLETWLQATGQAAAPQLAVSPPLLNLGAVSSHGPFPAQIRLRNTGRGLLTGQLGSDAFWLVPEVSTFAANDRVLALWAYADRLPVDQPAEGHVTVQSNGGEAQVTVRLRPSPSAAAVRQARPPAWAASVLLVLAVAGGVWLVNQLAQRWGLPASFDVAAWLEGGKGWLMLPLAASVLTLAAMLGSVHQWERLAEDAPLREWGASAAWVLGATFFSILLSALLLSYVKLPPALAVPWQMATAQLGVAWPLLLGGVAALITASGWAGRLRRGAGGAVLFVLLLVLWLVLILAGAMAGAWLAGRLNEALPQGLPDAGWSVVTLAGALLVGGLMTLLARALKGRS